MNDIYISQGNPAKNSRWLPASRRIARESCDYIPGSPVLSSPPPTPARFGSPVIIARPRHSAVDGTLFQEPSGVSWIVLEHLPDVQKSCRLSGNCNAVVVALRRAIMRCISLIPRFPQLKPIHSSIPFCLIRQLNSQISGLLLFYASRLPAYNDNFS